MELYTFWLVKDFYQGMPTFIKIHWLEGKVPWRYIFDVIYHVYGKVITENSFMYSRQDFSQLLLIVYQWRLLIILANSLDPDQGPNCLTFWRYFCKNFFKKLIFEKNQQTTKKHEKLPRMQ